MPYGTTFTGRYASQLEKQWHAYFRRRCPWPVRYVGNEHGWKDFEITLPSGVLPVEVKPRGKEYVEAAVRRLCESEEAHAAVVEGKPPGRWWYWLSTWDEARWVWGPGWAEDPVKRWRRGPWIGR
jgi:hypothetical protein